MMIWVKNNANDEFLAYIHVWKQISITNSNHNHEFKFYSGGVFKWQSDQITVRILRV